jgi:hypothetical protein
VIKLALRSKRPGAKPVPGRITGRGHWRPRLYREAIANLSSAGLKYPGGLGAAPPCLRPDQGACWENHTPSHAVTICDGIYDP